MKLNSNYLSKSYYVATMLQYNDELKKEGFRTETKKKFLFGGDAFIVDLYAENDTEKRIYDFQIAGKKDIQSIRTADLNELCANINAKPIVVYVKTPVEKQILFDELETIINDYFLSRSLPSELEELSGELSINAVKVDEILTVAFENALISLSGCATIYVTIQYEPEGGKGEEGRVYCESFPLSFTIGLDSDFNCKTLEYEIDLSEFEAKTDESKPSSASNKNYISKTKFDTEFKIYQELSECVLTMTGDVELLFPLGFDPLPPDSDQKAVVFEERARKAAESRAAADKAVKRYAPFMPKKLFQLLETITVKCGQQLYWYSKIVLKDNGIGLADEKEACEKRTDEIAERQAEFMDSLRKYLESLDVK